MKECDTLEMFGKSLKNNTSRHTFTSFSFVSLHVIQDSVTNMTHLQRDANKHRQAVRLIMEII